MNYDWIINAPVEHVKYGNGVVKSLQGMYVEIYFEASEKNLKFIYPESFESLLTMKDEELVERVQKDVALRKALVQEAERIHDAENPEKQMQKKKEQEIQKKKNTAILKKKLIARQSVSYPKYTTTYSTYTE